MPTMKHGAHRLSLGFTMVETLGVVTLVIILLAIAVPNAIGLQSSLRMAQLDAQAQQIYKAAQYRLTALQSTGKTAGDDGLAKQVASDSSAVQLTDPPAGYDESWSWTDREAYALNSNDPVVAEHLVSDEKTPLSKALNNGNFIILVSPATAEVFAVYYWEDDVNISGKAASTIAYDDVSAYSTRDQRKPLLLGYYGGGELDQPGGSDEPDEKILPLTFEVVNAEELYVKVSGGGAGSNSFNMTDYNPAQLTKISVYVNGKEFGNASGANLNYDEKTGVDVQSVVDSMRTDRNWHYNQLRNNSIPSPGADVKVTVKANYQVNGIEQEIDVPLKDNPGIFETTVNSLYEKNLGDTVYISKVRHLDNLRKARANSINLGYTKILVSDDIEFDGTKWKDKEVSSLSRTQGDNGLNPLTEIDPLIWNQLSSTTITSSSSGERGFMGYFETDSNKKPKVLSGFCIGANSSQLTATGNTASDVSANSGVYNAKNNVGLFDYGKFPMRGITLKDVRVLGRNKVGGFCGMADDTTAFEDCHISGNSFIACQNQNSTSYTAQLGGLAGYANNNKHVNVDNCSVDGVIYSTGSAVGGVYGAIYGGSCDYVTNTTVTADIYAGTGGAGPSVGNRSFAGGIIGLVRGDIEISHCSVGSEDDFATINTKSGIAGGIFGYSEETNTVSNCDVYIHMYDEGQNHESVLGGIIGFENHTGSTLWSTMSRCTVHPGSTITAGASIAGGLAGSYKGSAQNCASCASVEAGVNNSGWSWAGGLFGLILNTPDNTNAAIRDCTVGNGSSKVVIKGSGSFVGGLIGGLQYSQFTNCGVQGNSADTSQVIGRDCVGGFVGVTGYHEGRWWSNTNDTTPSFTRCYSSIDVSALNTSSATSSEHDGIGGFVGMAYFKPSFENCYSSGSVKGYKCVGGFAGWVNRNRGECRDMSFEKCYTTSNVRGQKDTGGFAGLMLYHNDFRQRDLNVNSIMHRCASYGRVRALDSDSAQAASIGGYAGRADCSSTNNGDLVAGQHWAIESVYGDCAYLQQDGSYNRLQNCTATQPDPQDYDEIKNYFSSYRLSASQSHPYSSSLQGQAFPFGCIHYTSDGQDMGLAHYGDWPVKE